MPGSTTDPTLGGLGDVLGDLSGGDDVAVAQLNDVSVGVDVGDDQRLAIRFVRLDAAGEVVQVAALLDALELALDAGLGLHLQLDPRCRLGSFLDLDRIEV